MEALPLRRLNGHVFTELHGGLWLIDTGAANSFGACTPFPLDGKVHQLPPRSSGLDVQSLSEFVGVPCRGLIGNDVLGSYDHIFDGVEGIHSVSSREIEVIGEPINLEFHLGIPVVRANIGGENRRVFFDTGAQLSYLPPSALTDYPVRSTFQDFYPGYGLFTTGTREVALTLGSISITILVGNLPIDLERALLRSGVEGILGNEPLSNRKIGYLPRRGLLTEDA